MSVLTAGRSGRVRRRHARRGPLHGAMLDVNTAVWLGRRLWRPVAADMLSRRPRRRD